MSKDDGTDAGAIEDIKTFIANHVAPNQASSRVIDVPGNHHMRPSSLITLSAALLMGVSVTGCSSWGGKTDSHEEQMRAKEYKFGSVFGTEGGINIFGGDKRKTDDGSGLGVNAFLWRASLDTLSFMPIASADPFGGVILTDWYTPPESAGERFKVNLYILDKQLRADGVRVSAFRQVRAGNDWRDAALDPATGRQIEDAVLTRARQLRVSQAAPK